MNKISGQKILDKAGTVLVDRRFWVTLFTLGSIIFGVPKLANDAEVLSQQATDWVVIIAQIVALVVVPLGLTMSWSKRPPSGLDYKELTIDKLIETATKDN